MWDIEVNVEFFFFLPRHTTTFVTFEQMLVSCLSLFGLESERGLPFSLEPLSRDVGVSRMPKDL